MVNLWIITGGTKEMAKEDTFLAQLAGMNPALKVYEAWMRGTTDLMAFAAKRFEKDLEFQKSLITAKPQDLPHLQMQFWQGVLDDYHEEAGRMVSYAREAGVPNI
jgi:hypothetical protein